VELKFQVRFGIRFGFEKSCGSVRNSDRFGSVLKLRFGSEFNQIKPIY
jgi:hypothetical protein